MDPGHGWKAINNKFQLNADKAEYLIDDIRNCLSIVTTEHLIHAYVTSQLDCGNSLLYGLPNMCILKLQRIQNSAA